MTSSPHRLCHVVDCCSESKHWCGFAASDVKMKKQKTKLSHSKNKLFQIPLNWIKHHPPDITATLTQLHKRVPLCCASETKPACLPSDRRPSIVKVWERSFAPSMQTASSQHAKHSTRMHGSGGWNVCSLVRQAPSSLLFLPLFLSPPLQCPGQRSGCCKFRCKNTEDT